MHIVMYLTEISAAAATKTTITTITTSIRTAATLSQSWPKA